MIRLILLSDFTESFSYNLLKGVLMYANSHEPWVVCRMPLSYKQTYGIKGVLEVGKNVACRCYYRQIRQRRQCRNFP